MKSDYFNWGSGDVIFWDLYDFDPKMPLENQTDELKEDLVQVRFGEDTILDIGWYPEFSTSGLFVLTVVCNENWDEPTFRKECKNIKELELAIHEGVCVAEGKKKKRNNK